MKQEQKIHLEEIDTAKKRMNLYLNIIGSLKEGMRKNERTAILANILMLARGDLLRWNKFDSLLESNEQRKCRQAVDDLLDLLDSLLMTYLKENLLSHESLDSLMDEVMEIAKIEKTYAARIAAHATGVDIETLKKFDGFTDDKKELVLQILKNLTKQEEQ